MPIIKLFKTDRDEEPFLIFCGASWCYEAENKKISVFFNGVNFQYPCEKFDMNNHTFYAYGEIVSPEENPEEVINW